MWTASLVLTCLGCMHMVLFVKEYTSRKMIWPHCFLKNIYWNIHHVLLVTIPTSFFWNVHVSIVQKILSNPLLVLDKSYVQIYLNFSCMSVLFITKVPTKKWQWPTCEQTLHSCLFPPRSQCICLSIFIKVFNKCPCRSPPITLTIEHSIFNKIWITVKNIKYMYFRCP